MPFKGMSRALMPGMMLVASAAGAAEIVLVQPGDRELSCEALAKEINDLAQASAEPAKKKKKGAFGFLGKALSVASPMLGTVGNGAGVMVAGQAAAAVQSAERETQQEQAKASSSLASVAQQRRTRLMTIFAEKKC